MPLKLTRKDVEQSTDTIPMVDEPSFHKTDFEQFGGLTIQPLTVTIVKGLVQGMQRMDMLQYVLDKPAQPLLVITDVGLSAGSGDMLKGLKPGDIVETVNGRNVSTLADLRRSFAPAGETCSKGEPDEWSLETRAGKETTFTFSAALERQRALVADGQKPLTPAVRAALKGRVPESFIAQAKAYAAEPVAVELRDVRRGGARWGPAGLAGL